MRARPIIKLRLYTVPVGSTTKVQHCLVREGERVSMIGCLDFEHGRGMPCARGAVHALQTLGVHACVCSGCARRRSCRRQLVPVVKVLQHAHVCSMRILHHLHSQTGPTTRYACKQTAEEGATLSAVGGRQQSHGAHAQVRGHFHVQNDHSSTWSVA